MKSLLKGAVAAALLLTATVSFAGTRIENPGQIASTPSSKPISTVAKSESVKTIEVQKVAGNPVTCQVCVNGIVIQLCISWCCANCPQT